MIFIYVMTSQATTYFYDMMKVNMLMGNGRTSGIPGIIALNLYEQLIASWPKWFPTVKAFCCRRKTINSISTPLPSLTQSIKATISCERMFSLNTGSRATNVPVSSNHSRMDSVIHYITTIPAIRNLICISHNDYLPNEFEAIQIEPDIFFELLDMKHNDGQLESIKFKLFCYEHEIQYIQSFIDRCNQDYERRMANKLGTNLYFFDMMTQSKNKRSVQNKLPDSHLIYTKHLFHTTRSFGNVFFEQRDKVKNHVDFFLNRKDWYEKKGIPYTLGFMFHGDPGCGKCLGYDTPVMMYDGSIKPVQDVKVGDKLMGDDSKPRNVLSLARGREKMYRIVPVKGDSYIVNESHILSLKHSGLGSIATVSNADGSISYKSRRFNNVSKSNKFKSFKTPEEACKYLKSFAEGDMITDISVKDYLKLSYNIKKNLKGYRVPVTFPHKCVNIDPYLLGYWLGDGASTKAQITTADLDIIEHLKPILDKIDIDLLKGSDTYGWNMRSRAYKPTNGFKKNKGCNKFLTFLQESNLINNKHIPDIYKYNSRDIQLEVLAGIIDSDGSNNNNCYDITLVNERLMDDIIYIARSLGFSAYKSICTKTCTNGTHGPSTGTYFRTMIHGKGLEEIPVVLSRKKVAPRQQVKNGLVTGIKIEPLGVDDYYGFEIDGNKRFLLGDFTVTHNTSSVKAIANTARRHIINIQLSQIKTKEQLRHLFFNDDIHVWDGLKTEKFTIPVHERLYVIEDIDAMGDTVLERKWKKPVVEEKKKVSTEDAWIQAKLGEEEENEPIDLSFLLNLLDGTLEASGRILCISSNFPERIDKALIRPGRIDMIVHFKKCNRTIIRQMVDSFYDQTFEDWTDESIEYKWSPAEVNQILFRNFNESQKAIEELKTLQPRDFYGFEQVETSTSYETFNAQ